jgi:hypothetical protein
MTRSLAATTLALLLVSSLATPTANADTGPPAPTFQHLQEGGATPLAWDDCRVHTFKIAGKPGKALRALARRTVTRTGARTGTRWVYTGVSTVDPVKVTQGRATPDADLIVKFTNMSKWKGFQPMVGYSDVTTIGSNPDASTPSAGFSFAVINTKQAGLRSPTKARAVLLREVGQAFGLGDSNKPKEVMYPTPGGNGRMTPVYRAGLAALKAVSACPEPPPPPTGLGMEKTSDSSYGATYRLFWNTPVFDPAPDGVDHWLVSVAGNVDDPVETVYNSMLSVDRATAENPAGVTVSITAVSRSGMRSATATATVYAPR